jgi:hypothetical protein
MAVHTPIAEMDEAVDSTGGRTSTGYNVDRIIPLSVGGADLTSYMHAIAFDSRSSALAPLLSSLEIRLPWRFFKSCLLASSA